MGEIRDGVARKTARSTTTRFLFAKDDQNAIATWQYDLIRIVHVFNVRPTFEGFLLMFANTPLQTELAITTHTMVTDIHRSVVARKDDVHDEKQSLVSNDLSSASYRALSS